MVARVAGLAVVLRLVGEQEVQAAADDVGGLERLPGVAAGVQVRLHERQDVETLLVGVQDVHVRVAQERVRR